MVIWTSDSISSVEMMYPAAVGRAGAVVFPPCAVRVLVYVYQIFSQANELGKVQGY